MTSSLFLRIAAASLATALLLFLASCGDDDDATKTAAPAPSASASAPSPSPSAVRSASPAASASAATSASPAASTAASTPSPSASPAPSTTTAPATQPPPPPPTATPVPSGPMTASVGVVETSRAFQFSPANVTVAPGGTVSFSWSDTAQFHDVVVRSGGGELGRSGDPAKSGSFSYTFSAPGTYQFVCEVHEASIPPMRGTVTVQ